MSVFKTKMHQIRFPLGLRRRPGRGSLHRYSKPLAVINGATFKGKEGRKRGGKWKKERL